MVKQQQLRWVRTTLLGRTPGWSPPAAPVGPWRAVWLERRRVVVIGEPALQSSLAEDGAGRIVFSCDVGLLGATALTGARLVAERAAAVMRRPCVWPAPASKGNCASTLRICGGRTRMANRRCTPCSCT